MTVPGTSVIIPAVNESNYLPRTITNLLSTATGRLQIIVVDYGGNGPRVEHKQVLWLPVETNRGERYAMNLAASHAKCTHLFRIDAHCDFQPEGWDQQLTACTGEKDITVAVLTAIYPPWDILDQRRKDAWTKSDKSPADWDQQRSWKREPGHWYGLCRFVVSEDDRGRKGLECKWQKANRDHAGYSGLVPNMGLTGCGFMLRKSFYDSIGGADESLPAMGAIGEEFALKAWHSGGKVQTNTDVTVGHIFGTGGYDTSGVRVAQVELYKRYALTYERIRRDFPDFEEAKLIRTDQPGRPIRTVTVNHETTYDTADDKGKLLRRRIEQKRYVWVETEHPDEKGWSVAQIEAKYGPAGYKIGEQIYYTDEQDELVQVHDAELVESK